MMKDQQITANIPSGRTPEQVCREAADYFDTIDELTPLITIRGGKYDGKSLADVMGHEDEVQADLRASGDWIEGVRTVCRDVAVRLDQLHTTASLNEQTDWSDALYPLISDLMRAVHSGS